MVAIDPAIRRDPREAHDAAHEDGQPRPTRAATRHRAAARPGRRRRRATRRTLRRTRSGARTRPSTSTSRSLGRSARPQRRAGPPTRPTRVRLVGPDLRSRGPEAGEQCQRAHREGHHRDLDGRTAAGECVVAHCQPQRCAWLVDPGLDRTASALPAASQESNAGSRRRAGAGRLRQRQRSGRRPRLKQGSIVDPSAVVDPRR